MEPEDLNIEIPKLSLGQQRLICTVVEALQLPMEMYVWPESDIFDEALAEEFGEVLRIHHAFSRESFSKDKFEYGLESVLEPDAQLAPRGNPGHDITIKGQKVSLKTQADKGIKEEYLWISKFMEMGKGDWENSVDHLKGLVRRFMAHMAQYDRIFSLRCLKKGKPYWKYELVEIPKELLEKADTIGELELRPTKQKGANPGYCYVKEHGEEMFQLYFDGGSERKLQIKYLYKKHCKVHATWKFKAQSAQGGSAQVADAPSQRSLL